MPPVTVGMSEIKGGYAITLGPFNSHAEGEKFERNVLWPAIRKYAIDHKLPVRALLGSLTSATYRKGPSQTVEVKGLQAGVQVMKR